jgi:hypothetical protein
LNPFSKKFTSIHLNKSEYGGIFVFIMVDKKKPYLLEYGGGSDILQLDLPPKFIYVNDL